MLLVNFGQKVWRRPDYLECKHLSSERLYSAIAKVRDTMLQVFDWRLKTASLREADQPTLADKLPSHFGISFLTSCPIKRGLLHCKRIQIMPFLVIRPNNSTHLQTAESHRPHPVHRGLSASAASALGKAPALRFRLILRRGTSCRAGRARRGLNVGGRI